MPAVYPPVLSGFGGVFHQDLESVSSVPPSVLYVGTLSLVRSMNSRTGTGVSPVSSKDDVSAVVNILEKNSDRSVASLRFDVAMPPFGCSRSGKLSV